MIILDEPFSNALLRQAVSDGYAKPFADRSPYKDPYLKVFLAKGLNKNVRADALWHLLLFEQAILAPFDNLDVSPLRSEGLLHDDLTTAHFLDEFRNLDEAPELVYEIRDLLIADVRKKGYPNCSRDALDEYVSLSRARRLGEYSEMLAGLRSHATYDDYKRFATEVGATLDGPSIFGPVKGAHLTQRLLEEITEQKFNDFKSKQATVEVSQELQNRAAYWLSLFRLSEMHNAPIRSSARTPKRLRRLNDNSELPADTILVVLRVTLNELSLQPRLTGIDDVLRLRADKFFPQFRALIFEWADKFAKGSEVEESNIRKEIQKASKSMKRIGKWRNVGRLYTYISLPIDVALFLIGLPIPTSLVGFGLQGFTDFKDRPYRWMLFGKQ